MEMRLKDKSRPKSPLSGFACFVQVIQDKHRSLHSDKHVIFSEFAKKCAERWREMPLSKRAPFEEMSRLDTKRYNREMGDYVQQQQQQHQLTPQHSLGSVHSQQQQQSTYDTPHHYHTNMRGGGMKRVRRLKDPAMPKRALSAFFFFCDQQRPRIRAAHPEWRVSEIAKELGRLWDECTDKAPFERQAQGDKLRYEDEMRQYKAGTFVLNPKRIRESVGSGITSRGDNTSSATVAASTNCFEIEGSREVDEMDIQGCDEEEDGDEAEGDGDEEEEEMDEEEEEDIEDDRFDGEAEVDVERARGITQEGLRSGSGPDVPKSGIDERNQVNIERGGTEFEKMEDVEKSEEEGVTDEDLEGGEEDEREEAEAAREEVGDAKAIINQSHQRQGPNAFSVASVVNGADVCAGGGVVGDKASEAGVDSPTAEDNDAVKDKEEG